MRKGRLSRDCSRAAYGLSRRDGLRGAQIPLDASVNRELGPSDDTSRPFTGYRAWSKLSRSSVHGELLSRQPNLIGRESG